MRFYFQARPCVLPVWLHGRLQVVRWGNRDRSDRVLPDRMDVRRVGRGRDVGTDGGPGFTIERFQVFGNGWLSARRAIYSQLGAIE
ncbi:hypothetical protein J8F10_16785 [Gemmata sp. G18]|uniref:Uncharacterized protein n=1 Tax=Gemmata palustris TaxID=2822762 RepID=A0ABS5BTB4_9BACT|nr:hypothetical protein [Gemmata palustris]MBP3956929.1 hypothetical protein [Gemmata palustris]